MDTPIEEGGSNTIELVMGTEANLFAPSNTTLDPSALLLETNPVSSEQEDSIPIKSPSKRVKLSSSALQSDSKSGLGLKLSSTSSESDDLKHKKYGSETPILSMPQTPELSANETELEDLGESEILDDEDDDVEKEDDDEDDVIALEDDDVESVVTRLISPALQQEREARKVEDRKLLALLAHFDEEQLNRFETFRRAAFAKTSIRRLIQSIATCSVSQNVVIAMAGATKVFIGELVEEALDFKERLGESGPLQPKHIREAHRLLSESGSCPTRKQENPLI